MKNNEKIMKRLNIIIDLLLKSVELLEIQHKHKTSEKLKIARLKQFGLKNPEIGLFFNKSAKDVAKQIYETKRERRGRKLVK